MRLFRFFGAWEVCGVITFFIGFLLPLSSAHASNMYEIFQKLRSLKNSDFSTIGSVCEQVASVEFKQHYPSPAYLVFTNINYGYGNRRALDSQLGELDVVVYNVRRKIIEVVAEVKCSNNLGKASKKASTQLERLRTLVQDNSFNQTIQFQFQRGIPAPFNAAAFVPTTRFISIAQASHSQGNFDDTLPLTLPELTTLQQCLYFCQQHKNECESPQT